MTEKLKSLNELKEIRKVLSETEDLETIKLYYKLFISNPLVIDELKLNKSICEWILEGENPVIFRYQYELADSFKSYFDSVNTGYTAIFKDSRAQRLTLSTIDSIIYAISRRSDE